MPRLQIVDFDVVDLSNVTTQGYLAADVGMTKVAGHAGGHPTARSGHPVEAVEDRYRPRMEIGQAVFCCVDSIDARAAIWRSAGPRCRFWCDGRMLGEVLRVLAVADDIGRDHYPTTLFAQSEAQPGAAPPAAQSTPPALTAGLMVHQFTRWLRGIPVDRDTSLNLLAGELNVC